MFEKVLPELIGKNTGDSASDTRSESSFAPLPGPKPTKICFVDGGNGAVFDSSQARVEFVRVYATIYDGKKRIDTKKEEGLVLIKNDGKGKISVKGFPPLKLELLIPEDHSELRFGKEYVSLGSVANLVRFTLECDFLGKHGKECDLLVRDGSLVGNNEYEDKGLGVFSDSLVAGLSKTNTLPTTGLGPENLWISHVKKDNDVNISLVKLHAKSEYVFRLDAKEKAEEIAAALSQLASDPVFLGYPYPLIEADKMARVSNRELDTLKTRFAAEAGNDWKHLKQLAHGKSAHSVLDSI